MIRNILLSLLVLIAATSAAYATEQKSESNFNERKANLAEVHAMRVGYGAGTIRIVLDVTKKIDFNESYAENPSRMILDLKNTWLNPTVPRETEINSLAAKKIRIAQFDPSTVRIVIETMAHTKMFNLDGGAKGYRFVIDVGNSDFKPEPVKPEPVKPEPVKPEPVKPEPVKPEPVKPEPVKPEPVKPEPVKPEPVKPEPVKPEPVKPEPVKPEPVKPEPVKPEPVKPEPVKPVTPAVDVPKDVELVDPDDEEDKKQQLIKEQREREKAILEQKEREKKERELKEKQERELKEQQEREAKEQQEKLIKEQREREKQLERERKEKEKQEKRDKKNKDKEKGTKDKEQGTRDKDKDEPLTELDTDLKEITALSGKLIAIDPGHGGNDAGAIGPTGVMEKTVTLNVALELKKLLEAEGATVIMTRETDTTVSYKGAKASDIEELGARCDVGNRAGAHIFISIHADSFTRPEARGTTGYYYSRGSGAGQRLADCIRRNLVEQLGTPSRGTQPCNFYVVKNTDMPATLIELGFISNRDEEKLLNSPEGVRKAAQGILDGIEDYFG